MCKTHRNEFKKIFNEKSCELKSSHFYQTAMLEIGNLEPGQDFFGIIGLSPIRFFGIPDFFTLFPPCIYHDIFEGVFTIIFKFSLQYIIDKKLITFREFQNKTQSLNLRNKDKKNFPLISFERLDQIRFIASESFTMARFYLHLIDFLDADDEIFCIVQLLVKIINILMLFDFKLEHLIILENLITSFLSLCSNQSGINMTVKFHHMIHYSRLIEKFGPQEYIAQSILNP